MKKKSICLAICAAFVTASWSTTTLHLPLFAQEPQKQEKPIKAMLITGGCCHDYEQQKKIITEGISARSKIKIDWTVVHQGGSTTDTKIPLFENQDWAKGYDIVIHNECFAKIDDKDWVERVLKPHREGVNAIVIHCAMHTFRDLKSNEYRDFLGVESRSHGPHHSFKVENLEPADPIMKGFGKDWETPMGELYYVNNIGGKATPLARALSSGGRKKQEVCIWKNQYGKSRVFGTTIGHHNETMSTPKYLNFLTRGFLWAVDRFDEKHITSPPIKRIPKNLAFRKPAIASANQDPHLPRAATDGSTSTRYCADNAEPNDWFQIDLEKPEELTGVQVHWEQAGRFYRFKLEGSADGKEWQMLHDGTKNKSKAQVQTYDFKAKNIRFLKMTCTETEGGAWYSFFEFRVFGTKFEEIDEAAFLNRPLNDPTALLAKMKIPEGFDAKIFAAPPQANYPVCLTSSYDGVVFVGVDKNGSLDKQTGRGKVVRCIDKDRDGVADEFTTFCEVDSPRGLVWDRDRLFVLHPPDLSVYFDDDGDGKADRKETLVKGIGFDLDFRGADHTTNGIRMGIDGWIYVAVGDYGFIKAVGTDNTELQLKGGGVVRVRPDGTGLEVYARGLRNICDIAIDPFMNIFTRDNTNDGGGWDIRVSHIIHSANYGYPSLYKNFNDEIMPPMADYGGGSGTGALYVSEESLPKKYQNALFTCDWGRSKVFYHPLKKDGATFTVEQEDFLSIPRPTDMDVDANGNIYVASWNNGQFKYAGENIGYIVILRPKRAKQNKLPNLKSMRDEEVGKQLFSGSDAMRRAASRELHWRRAKTDSDDALRKLSVVLTDSAKKSDSEVVRTAVAYAIQPLTQGYGKSVQVGDDVYRASLGYNTLEVKSGFPLIDINWDDKERSWFFNASPMQQVALMNDIVAEGYVQLAPMVIDFASKIKIDRSKDKEVKTPVNSSDKALRHVAIQTLAKLAEVDALLNAANSDSSKATVAFDALKYIHSKEAVDGLISVLSRNKNNQQAWETLIRLYHTEGPYTGKWWGTRPDTFGPYYTRDKWEMTDGIGSFVESNFAQCDKPTQTFIAIQLDRHKVRLPSISAIVKKRVKDSKPAVEMVVKVPTFDKNNPNQLGNIKYEVAVSKITPMKGNVKKGAEIFKQQSCAACHTVEKGAKAVGPQLVDIGKRYKRIELLESIIKPNAKIAQGFATQIFATEEGLTYTGFVTREAGNEVEIRTAEGKSVVISKNIIEARKESKKSVMPEGLVSNLNAKQMASLLAYLESLKSEAN